MSMKEDILTAFQTLGPADNTVWEADGSPSLKTIRDLVGNDKITAADVDASTCGARRPGAEGFDGSPPADKEDIVTTTAPQTQPEKDAETVAEARTKFAAICAKIELLDNERAEITKSIDALIKDKDVQAKLIERLGPRVSFAEGVKAIQAQTTKKLAELKESTVLATAALKASGTVVYPSVLDASRGNMKRSPEAQQNYAKFVHQNANRVAQGL